MRSRRAQMFMLVFFFGALSAQAVPRFYVEATVSPWHPGGTHVFRAGLNDGRRQLFAGYLNTTFSPEVDKDGYYWTGNRQLLAGARWYTTSNPLAIVVPSFGGGLCAGHFQEEVWIDRVFMHPEDGQRLLETDAIQSVGLFAEAGVRVPIRPTSFTVAADIHFNFAYGRDRRKSGDTISETETIRGFTLVLAGASYTF